MNINKLTTLLRLQVLKMYNNNTKQTYGALGYYKHCYTHNPEKIPYIESKIVDILNEESEGAMLVKLIEFKKEVFNQKLRPCDEAEYNAFILQNKQTNNE